MDYDRLRRSMVEEQLIARGIRDRRVINAFYKVERHRFLPEDSGRSAYGDFPLPIGNGQTISQPYMVALMTECLQLSGNEKVLEVGTGSGYQAAILAELAKEVCSIERIETLAKRAELILQKLGYKNITVKVGDGSQGLTEEAPFDGIIVTAASPCIPTPLTEQLSEKGRLVIPLGDSFSQMLTVIEKRGAELITEEVCSCIFVPLIGKYGYKNT